MQDQRGEKYSGAQNQVFHFNPHLYGDLWWAGFTATDAVDRARRASFIAGTDRVLNEDWRSTLLRWYPAMQETCDAKAA
jgi:hypothetical protein